MEKRILNLLKEPKKYFIILIPLLAINMWLLWKAKWMLYLLLMLASTAWFQYQTALLLLVLTLITWIAALIILREKKKSFSLLIKMRQVKISGKSLLEDSAQKRVIRWTSAITKTLMNFLLLMGGICLLGSLIMLALSPLKMF